MIPEIISYKVSENPLLAAKGNAIRYEVFVVEQNVDPALEYENEEEARHYLLTGQGKAVATARWRQTPKGIKLERFATLKKERGKGYAAKLLLKMLEDVRPLNKPVYLNSQTTAIGFYEKYGFVRTGPPFFEADIEHYLMVFDYKVSREE